MADYTIKRGDLEPPLRVQLTERDPTSSDPRKRRPLDTTDAVSAKLKAISRDGSRSIDFAGTLEDPRTDGWFTYDWQVQDTQESTWFHAEVELMWPGGRPQTIPNDGTFVIEVEDDRG